MKSISLTFFLFIGHILFGQDLSNAINHYKNNKPDLAAKIFKSIDDDSKQYGEAQFYLGRIAFDKEDYDAAEEYFEEAIDYNDNNSDYHLWLGNTYGVVAQDANMFKQGLLAPKIKSEFERAVELNDKNVDALMGLVQYYTQAPGFMGGSYEKALVMANKIAAVNKLQAHSARITVYSAQEDYGLMEKEYKAAANLDKRWILNLGYFYQQRQSYDKAFSTFDRLLSDPELKMAGLYQIGRTSAFSGLQTSKGIASLEEYLSNEEDENAPSHAAAKMRLAMIYEKMNNKTVAVKYYKESLKDDPKMEQAKEGLERLGQ